MTLSSPLPLTRDLVFIGGGHAHALALRSWGMKPLPGVRVTLINPGASAPYTGMLPGHIAGHYPREALQIDMVKLARFAGARLLLSEATGIDREAKCIQVDGFPDVSYDVASIDIGITSAMPEIEGWAEHAVAAKPLGAYAGAWDRFVRLVGEGKKSPEVAVIGAGVAGAELAMAMHHRLAEAGTEPKVALIDTAKALAWVGGPARAVLFERLRAADIRIIEDSPVAKLTTEGVTLEDGTEVPANFIVGAAGARPHSWLSDLGLEHENGYLSVDAKLRCVNDPALYAVGDCAHMTASPRPKAGVFAVRQAPVLLHNLKADLRGTSRRNFKPQKSYLKLISLGGKEALADKWGLAPKGGWVWKLKDRIDLAFMNKFSNLPNMKAPALPRAHAAGVSDALGKLPLCGGCGSKVGRSALKAALSRMPAPERDDVMSLPGDDAAILAMENDYQVISTDHLRAFTADHVMQTRIAAVHAMGDVWAMGCQPQVAVATIILPRMSEDMQARTLAEIMDTANETFRAAGAEVVGGHSSQGAELVVGFSVTGLSERYPTGLDGAEAGDALILTKPIGSGTLLAAEMQGKANGAWIGPAMALMMQPQGRAAEILKNANAMTDVTGFGLAGHLMGICEASTLAAHVILDELPLMIGAADMAEAGVRSSLYASNRSAIQNMTKVDRAAATLLFDPQTAGGLLACVPAAKAEGLVGELAYAGYPAALIGHMEEGAPFITLK